MCVSGGERARRLVTGTPHVESAVDERIDQAVGHAEKEDGHLQAFTHLPIRLQLPIRTIQLYYIGAHLVSPNSFNPIMY